MARSSEAFDNWREWLDRSERQINSLLGEITASPTFGKAQARMMETLLKTQQGMNSAAERYFTAINVPTRTDILEIGGRLSQIEERLANVEAVLLSMAGASTETSPARSRPARTRKPPAPAAKVKKASSTRSAKKKATKKTAKKKLAKKKPAGKKAAKKAAGRKAAPKKTAPKKARAKATRKKASGARKRTSKATGKK